MAVAVGEQRRKKEAMEALVADISRGSEEAVFPAIRSALERGWTFSFMGTLVESKKKKEADIDKICSRHYGGFLASVHELLLMKGSTGKLSELIVKVNEDFSSVGKELVQVLSSVEVLETEKESTRRVYEASLHCQEVARLMVQASEQIAAEDHYTALRTIGRLQIEQHNVTIRPFLAALQVWLPNSINRLLDAARDGVDQWTNNVHGKCSLLGVTVLRKYASLCVDSPGTGIGKIFFSRIKDTTNTKASSRDSTGRSKSTIATQSMMKLTSISISLLYIQRNAKVFRLQSWVQPGDMQDTIPKHLFQEANSQEGLQLLQQLPEQLAPIHKALHVFSTLGELRSLHDHCAEMRLPMLSSFRDSADIDVEVHGVAHALASLLNSTSGFFVIECVCRQCIQDQGELFFSWQELVNLWEMSCKDIADFCTRHIDAITTPDEAMVIKETLLVFAESMSEEAFGLRPNTLLDIMQVIWNRFEKLQLDYIMKVCSIALDNSSYQPMTITSEAQFISDVKAYKLENIQLEDTVHVDNMNQSAISAGIHSRKSVVTTAATLDALENDLSIGSIKTNRNSKSNNHVNKSDDEFSGRRRVGSFVTQTFPFSEALPKIMHELHLMITRFFTFSVKNKNLTAIGESVCNAIQKAFMLISQTMLRKLLQDGAETALSKACQISIDAATFSHTTNYLKSFVSAALNHFKWSDSIDQHLPQAIAVARKDLADVSCHAQDLVFELLACKVDDLLGSLEFIVWAPDSYPTGPHESIEEVVDYLRATFMWLTHLPQSAREAAHFTCCTKVTSGMIEYLLSPRVTRVNILSIVALELDVKRLEEFGDSCGVRQLSMCFAQLRELTQALLHPDLDQFGENPQLRQVLFPKLDPSRLARVIEKMSPSPPVAVSANLHKMDKKFVLTLSKKLKMQTND